MVKGQSLTYSVIKAPFSSDRYDEFSPVYYKNGIVFQQIVHPLNFQAIFWTRQGTSEDLLYWYHSGVKWENAKLFSKDLRTKFNDGPVTFNSEYDTIYFSRNLEVEGKLENLSTVRNKLGIFYAVLVGDEWTKLEI